MGKTLVLLFRWFVQSSTRLYYVFLLSSFAIDLEPRFHFLLPSQLGFPPIFFHLSRFFFSLRLSRRNLLRPFVLVPRIPLQIVPMGFFFCYFLSFFLFPFFFPPPFAITADELIPFLFLLTLSRGLLEAFPSSFLTPPFLIPPAIYCNKQKQPHYIDKMPIPCSGFKSKVMLFGKMMCIQSNQTHGQKNMSQ